MTKKAVALISGGLDSMLAAKVVQEQGVHVEGINFFTGFCVEGHTHAIRNQDKAKPKRNNALWVAEQLGIKLHIVDVSEDYKDVVINPRYGYGQHLNPCLDCKIFMVDHARMWCEENDFDFIITGEVIGQRPKSQRKATMPLIAREAQVEDRLLRPLCAQNLPPTRPESEGWVDREQLFGFSGRSRKPQIELAEKYGFSDFAQPAGGCCFLTDKTYSAKLSDLWQARGERRYEIDDIVLLKVGRHMRPRPYFKLIIARDDGENRYLEGYRRQFTFLRPIDVGGGVALVDGELKTPEDVELAAALVARYSQGRTTDAVAIQIQPLGGVGSVVTVKPIAPTDVDPQWHV